MKSVQRVALMWAGLTLACATGCGGDEPPTETLPTPQELSAIVHQGAAASDPIMRAESMRLIARAGVPELHDQLRRGAEDDHPMVLSAAVESQLALGQQGAERNLLSRLSRGDVEQRRALLRLILRVGRPELQASAMTRIQRQTADLRATAFQQSRRGAVGRVPYPVDFLARLLEDQPDFAPVVAAELVARGRNEVLDAAHLRLQSDVAAERLASLRILAETPSRNAWSLLRWMRANGSDDESELATIAITRLGDDSYVDEVIDMLHRRQSPHRLRALRALSAVASPALRGVFSEYRVHDDPELRRAALDGLMAIGISTEELMPYVDDDDPDLYYAVVRILLEHEPAAIPEIVCPYLRGSDDPNPLLTLLWIVRQELGALDSFAACSDELERLSRVNTLETAALASRIRFSLDELPPARTANDISTRPEILYAYLDESLARDPVPQRDLYLSLLSHELLPIRLVAALGLLRGGPLPQPT